MKLRKNPTAMTLTAPIEETRAFAALLILLAAALLPAPADAQELTCACQKQLVCGADSCDESEEASCASTEIRIAIAPPRIRLCSSGNCLQGEASVTGKTGSIVVLNGSYRQSAQPEQNPTSVTALIDTAFGTGMIQAADEEGVSQYSMICQPAAASGN